MIKPSRIKRFCFMVTLSILSTIKPAFASWEYSYYSDKEVQAPQPQAKTTTGTPAPQSKRLSYSYGYYSDKEVQASRPQAKAADLAKPATTSNAPDRSEADPTEAKAETPPSSPPAKEKDVEAQQNSERSFGDSIQRELSYSGTPEIGPAPLMVSSCYMTSVLLLGTQVAFDAIAADLLLEASDSLDPSSSSFTPLQNCAKISAYTAIVRASLGGLQLLSFFPGVCSIWSELPEAGFDIYDCSDMPGWWIENIPLWVALNNFGEKPPLYGENLSTAAYFAGFSILPRIVVAYCLPHKRKST